MNLDYSRLLAAIDNFRNKNILCIGDIMLDRYVYGDVNRISPEAPVPVLSNIHEVYSLGAAGNVAKNIASLGAKVEFYAATGTDSFGIRVKSLLEKESLITSYIYTYKGDTTTKTRYISGNQQILRVDIDGKFVGVYSLPKNYEGIDCIIISDYCKGMIDNIYASKIIGPAIEKGIPVVVDSKNSNLAGFEGATVITPNLKELASAVGCAVYGANDNDVRDSANALLLKSKINNVLVTRSEYGMSLVNSESVHHIPVFEQEVYDVTGAGDTVAAIVALGLASGLSMYEASYLANIAAAIVVCKRGTAVVVPSELKQKTLAIMDSHYVQSDIKNHLIVE